MGGERKREDSRVRGGERDEGGGEGGREGGAERDSLSGLIIVAIKPLRAPGGHLSPAGLPTRRPRTPPHRENNERATWSS